jgi:hypothetical protein
MLHLHSLKNVPLQLIADEFYWIKDIGLYSEDLLAGEKSSTIFKLEPISSEKSDQSASLLTCTPWDTTCYLFKISLGGYHSKQCRR